MHKREEGYTQIPNRLLNDPNLSLRAKGLFSFMRSKPPGWNFTIRSMAAQLREGKASITTALQELKSAGYVIYEKRSDGKGVYRFTEEPNPENRDLDTPMTDPNPENPDQGFRDVLVRKIKEEDDNPNPEKRDLGNADREEEQIIQELFSFYRLHTKNAGKKSEALKAYKEQKIPNGISLDDLKKAATMYLNDPEIATDERGKKIVYSLANFLRNEIYLNYLPHRLRIELDDRVFVGEYDRQSEILHADDGRTYRLDTSRLAELLSEKKLTFIFGTAS